MIYWYVSCKKRWDEKKMFIILWNVIRKTRLGIDTLIPMGYPSCYILYYTTLYIDLFTLIEDWENIAWVIFGPSKGFKPNQYVFRCVMCGH